MKGVAHIYKIRTQMVGIQIAILILLLHLIQFDVAITRKVS